MALPYDIANSAPPCPWDTGKLPPTGHIMSPSGHKLLPSGLEPAALRPSGSNLRPSGDIIFGPRAATFPVSRGRGCRIVTIALEQNKYDIPKYSLLNEILRMS